ncbi:MAG TPA: hypothetical protein VK633_08460 [Verrucomicrobiae bacterium]|nr:hypothetical protein [Verrucomicrobiae bacterium]
MVAAGYNDNLVLKADGTVIGWGYNGSAQTNVPTQLGTNAIAISAGGYQSLALKRDVSLIQWGQTNGVPPALTDIRAIASGTDFHLALRTNGTVVAWGLNAYGQTNVPANATNVVAIACGYTHALALKGDGTILVWGSNTVGQINIPPALTNPATAKVMAIAAGYYHSMALRNDGTVISWGYNRLGSTNTPAGLTHVKLIAAGGYQSLAALNSSWLQYSIDVAQDLLLIYNTNSADSIVVKDYYLQHRPLVANANVLGIGCPPQETISRDGGTNLNLSSITRPILNWLTNNPTKRPQYWILFLDIPSRINAYTNTSRTATTNYFQSGGFLDNSVSYELNSTMPGSPLVTHINMDTTNDCKAYIDKLEYFGTNYSPGKLIISALAGGYGNTNYVLDNIRTGPDYVDYSSDGGSILAAITALQVAGAPSNAILYVNGLETRTNGVPYNLPHPTEATNLAGYISWGSHSSLGNAYATNSNGLHWSGDSRWWIIETIESYNGYRYLPDQGHMLQWFPSYAFGGTAYSRTPVGAVSHTDEPGAAWNDPAKYFSFWAAGKNFAISAWNSRQTTRFQAVGDPLVRQ